MHGETVFVLSKSESAHDRFGNPTYEIKRTQVDNVLIDVSPSADFVEPGRYETAENIITLHFPKTFNKSLFGCEVEVRGTAYKVIGDPMWYSPEDTPTPWNYPVKVEHIDG